MTTYDLPRVSMDWARLTSGFNPHPNGYLLETLFGCSCPEHDAGDRIMLNGVTIERRRVALGWQYRRAA